MSSQPQKPEHLNLGHEHSLTQNSKGQKGDSKEYRASDRGTSMEYARKSVRSRSHARQDSLIRGQDPASYLRIRDANLQHQRPGSVSSHSTRSDRKKSASRHSHTRRRSSATQDGRRPAGPQRVRTMPSPVTAQPDLEAIYALHQRACSLFRPESVRSSSPKLPTSFEYDRAFAADSSIRSFELSPTAESSNHTTVSSVAEMDDPSYVCEEDEPYTYVPPATVIHWTSPETRQRDYAEHDATRSGIRGIIFKYTPRCWWKNTIRLHDGTEDAREGSVRRYRLVDPEEGDDDDSVVGEDEKVEARNREKGGRDSRGRERSRPKPVRD